MSYLQAFCHLSLYYEGTFTHRLCDSPPWRECHWLHQNKKGQNRKTYKNEEYLSCQYYHTEAVSLTWFVFVDTTQAIVMKTVLVYPTLHKLRGNVASTFPAQFIVYLLRSSYTVGSSSNIYSISMLLDNQGNLVQVNQLGIVNETVWVQFEEEINRHTDICFSTEKG